MSLRERNRRNTLAVTQRTAVSMFIDEGFDEVRVARIADEVGMAPSTLYRHFPTKESIVLWDEHADDYSQAVETALEHQPPFAALRHGFVSSLAGRYESDGEFQLQRVTLIYRTPAVHAAAAQADMRDRDHLTQLLVTHLMPENRDTAGLLAGAALLAADWAFDRWQSSSARSPLADLVDEAFDRLSHLEDLR